MSSSITCPYCRRAIVPDARGRCPTCAVELPDALVRSGQEAADEAFNPYAAPLAAELVVPGQELAPGLRRVGTGVGLTYFALIVMVLLFLGTMALGFATAFVGRPGQRGGPPTFFMLFSTIALVGFWGAALMDFVGRCLCIAVPVASGGRGLAIAAVVLQVLGVVGPVIGAMAFAPVMGFSGVICGFAAAVCYLLFLRKTALFIGRDDLARRARTVLIGGVGGVLYLAALVFVFTTAEFGRQGEGVRMLGSLAFFIAAVVLFVMYASLLNSLRIALRRTS